MWPKLSQDECEGTESGNIFMDMCKWSNLELKSYQGPCMYITMKLKPPWYEKLIRQPYNFITGIEENLLRLHDIDVGM